MLIVRRAQMEVLERYARREFEQAMIDHLREFFPDDCRLLGEDGLRDRVHDGIRAAAVWSVTVERDVCTYLDLMFALGAGFDSDPSLPWARAILSDRTRPSSRERVAMLRVAALEHLRRVP